MNKKLFDDSLKEYVLLAKRIAERIQHESHIDQSTDDVVP